MPFPTSEQNTAYSAIVNVLRNDPILKREFGKNLHSWTGEKVEPPSSANVPYLQLRPRSAPNQDWQDTGHVGTDLIVDIVMVLGGVNILMMFDAWEAILRALWPKDQARQDVIWDRLTNGGVGTIIPAQGTIAVREDSGGLTLVGHGELRVPMSLRLRTETEPQSINTP